MIQRTIIILFLVMMLIAGCSNTSSIEITEINVSAATSLKDALGKIAGNFEKRETAKIVFNFAPSGDLMTQIKHGAPADVFISAGKKQMDDLEQNGLIDKSSRLNLLGNDLVVVIPRNSNLTISSIEHLPALSSVNKIAIGEPATTPAGQYTKEAFEKAGIWTIFQSKLVMGKDIRQVLNYVETGNAGMGVVYSSDARVSKDTKVIFEIPGSYHSPIVYPLAILKNANQPEMAARFIEYLKSAEAREVFKEFGFKPAVN